jgi:hypothetical protein
LPDISTFGNNRHWLPAITESEICSLIDSSFAELFRADMDLFTLGVDGISEQTLTFRLGHYLQKRFTGYNVDCEYNRYLDGLKNDEQVDQEWMKPDIIVHWRRRNDQNLLVIEAKKARRWPADWPKTESKLAAFTRRPGKYEYRLGLAWKIAASGDATQHEAIWFKLGNVVAHTSLQGGAEKFIERSVLNVDSMLSRG